MELGNELEAPCKVMVLMSTYNGQRYLQEQLDSIYRQKDVVCSVYVRDDGSSDGTCNLLEWEQERGALKWYAGRNLGGMLLPIRMMFGWRTSWKVPYPVWIRNSVCLVCILVRRSWLMKN